jgi:hypothetical protein
MFAVPVLQSFLENWHSCWVNSDFNLNYFEIEPLQCRGWDVSPLAVLPLGQFAPSFIFWPPVIIILAAALSNNIWSLKGCRILAFFFFLWSSEKYRVYHVLKIRFHTRLLKPRTRLRLVAQFCKLLWNLSFSTLDIQYTIGSLPCTRCGLKRSTLMYLSQ